MGQILIQCYGNIDLLVLGTDWRQVPLNTEALNTEVQFFEGRLWITI